MIPRKPLKNPKKKFLIKLKFKFLEKSLGEFVRIRRNFPRIQNETVQKILKESH